MLSLALLVAPATGYIALHEFHPEAFAALFLLLMWHARLAGRQRLHWLWFACALGCKENIALLLAAYCTVHALIEGRRPLRDLASWYLAPMAVALVWLLLCTK
jgi:uncharacterized membrane protein